MKRRRIHRKDEYLGLRLPKADKDQLEDMARVTKRDPSDLAWVLICEGLQSLRERLREQPGHQTTQLQTAAS